MSDFSATAALSIRSAPLRPLGVCLVASYLLFRLTCLFLLIVHSLVSLSVTSCMRLITCVISALLRPVYVFAGFVSSVWWTTDTIERATIFFDNLNIVL